MKRTLGLIAFLLLGNAQPDTPALPEALTAHIVDGQLRTDDFSWMRGAFDGADDKQRADWDAIGIWAETCGVAGRKAILAELAALNIKTQLEETGATGSAPCISLQAFLPMAKQAKSWEEFRTNEIRARQIFEIYQFGATTARQHMPYEPAWGTKDAWALLSATVMEQVYRKGFGWAGRENYPKIDPELEPYLNAHLNDAMGKADRENTDMLKAMVESSGWPSIQAVGRRASANAWLLVQHADHDPVFQLKALRLMEPLASKNEVSKRNYAYLYDRVMLKLNGKQRFGTQFGGCDGDEYKLRPLEQESQLDALRIEYQLEPIAEYRKSMKNNYGPCRSD